MNLQYTRQVQSDRVCVCVLVNQSCPTLRLCGLYPSRLFCPWNSPGKNSGVNSHFLLQGIFSTQGSNLGLLHSRQSLRLHLKAKLKKKKKISQRNYQSYLIKKNILQFCFNNSELLLIVCQQLTVVNFLFLLLSLALFLGRKYLSMVYIFLKIFFQSSFRFTEKLSGKYRVL